ncbi:tyrosine-type recombinase/integrase [Kitasatospora cineracea]|uniref:tyrosine-type recombinase/integrase n=1 Tax=Kitasatospora cineracea TaxID=88074 RepID=UPI0033E06A46
MEFLLKPTTYARYRAYVLGELIPVFGRLRLEDLARDHIAACTHQQFEAGRGHQAVYHCLAALSSALGTAVRTHRLPFNAAQPLPVRRPRADERAPWSAEQAVGFLTHCRNVDPAFADLFETIIGTGLRRGEALGLQRPRVRIDDRVMFIRHTLSAMDNHELVLTAPKTKESRTRHLAATLALEGNVPMAVISKILRHSALSTTANIYSHLTWDVAMAAVHTIEARLCLIEARARP